VKAKEQHANRHRNTVFTIPFPYMIAVGGAGSSGLPAFRSGTWIM
jgi:hypothetical protein